MTVILSNELIEAGRSDRGGWNRTQLLLIGVPWPPEKGWKARRIGKSIEDKAFLDFLALKMGVLECEAASSH
jgi:hypothetical protein